MKKVLLAVAATLVLNMPAFALVDGPQDFKSLAPKMLKDSRGSSTLKSTKHDLAIVYGGQDIARKITNNSFSA